MLPVTRDVIVLCWDAATTADRRALEIAGLLGAEATAVVLSATVLSDAASIHQKIPACRCLIVDVETLASATEAMRTGVQGLRILTTAIAQHVLVYGFQPTSRHAAI